MQNALISLFQLPFPSFVVPINSSLPNSTPTMLILLLLLASIKQKAEGRLFQWRPSNRFVDAQNWLNGAKPCAGDFVRMGGAEPADEGIQVAILNQGMLVRELELPDNGVLFFHAEEDSVQRTVELGGANPAPWQQDCGDAERASGDGGQDVFFIGSSTKRPNLFDRENWHIYEEDGTKAATKGLLDAERVPSAFGAYNLIGLPPVSQDAVLFPEGDASKVFIDVPASVESLNFSGQTLSSAQFSNLLYTVEGQFQFRLGARLGADVDLMQRFQMRWPTGRVILVGQQHKSAKQAQRAAFYGAPSANFFEPQFSALCQFVACPPVDQFCTHPVRPVGQCCHQCGALVSFRQGSLNFTLARTIVAQFNADAHLPWGMGVSFVRVDKDDYQPLYQLTVLSPDPINFDEALFCSTLWDAFRRVQQRGINAHLSVDYRPSHGSDYFDMRSHCSVQRNIIHLRTLFKGVLLFAALFTVLALAFRTEYRRNARLRLWLSTRLDALTTSEQFASLQVSWQRARDRVDLLSVGQRRQTEPQQQQQRTGGFMAEFVNRAFAAGSLAVGKRDRANAQEQEERQEEEGGEEGRGNDEKQGEELINF